MQETSNQILTELYNSGSMRQLVRSGHLSVTLLHHMDIYQYINAQIKGGCKKKVAIANAMQQFKVSQRTVYNVIGGLR